MERTQADVVYPPLAECNKLGYHVYYLCGIQYAVYGGLVYHITERKYKKNGEYVLFIRL